MTEELALHRCTRADGRPVVVREHRHLFTTDGGDGRGQRPGAAWLTLTDGEPVRLVDADAFAVVATGELLRHDKARCACAGARRATFILRRGGEA